MRTISFSRTAEAVERLCIRAMCMLPPEVVMLLECACDEEDNDAARAHLTALYDNCIACGLQERPVCREPSRAILIAGGALAVEGGLEAAAREGLRRAIEQGMPLTGELEIRIDGDGTALTLIPACPRSESASFSCGLVPGPLEEQVVEFLSNALRMCPHRQCFPAFIGLGLGASEDEALRLARDALRRPMDSENGAPALAALERTALETLCAMDPVGNFSVLSVNVNAGKAVDFCAALIGCHAVRRASMEL